jgi:hypothetical protein
MANQHTDEPKLNITMSDLKDMLAALVAEMKKPVVDHDLLARNEAAKQRIRAQREESAADLKQIQDNCSHLREDGTSRVAWHEQYMRALKLFYQIGFCQACNKHYHPEMEDKADFMRMLKVPSGKPGLIMG